MEIQALFSLAKAQDPSPDKALPEPCCLSKHRKTGSHGSTAATACHAACGCFKASLVEDLPKFYRELKDFGCQRALCKETTPLVCKPVWSPRKDKPVWGGLGAPICWRGLKSNGDGVRMRCEQPREEPSGRQPAREKQVSGPAALERSTGWLLPSCSNTHTRLHGRSQAGRNVQRDACMRVHPHTPDFLIASSCIYV